MPWKPPSPGVRPTLGHLVIEWIEENLAQPETQEYAPLILTREQCEFVLALYELDPTTGQRIVRRGIISRSRGWGKSPFTAALAAVEALAPVVPAGWDSEGQPVARPWSDFRRPLVEIAAVSEDQVETNTWAPLMDVLSGPVLSNYPGTEPMGSHVNLPYGRIQKRTAAAGSAKGAPAHFVVCDQTEAWTKANGGVKLFNTLRNNVIKRGGHLIESPNAFTPGEGSVAESSMQSYQLIKEGKTKLVSGVYYDHREAPPETELGERNSLMHGLAIAYGDSAAVPHCAIHSPPCEWPGWVDLDHIAASIWEPDADIQVSRSDWLNQVTHASDAWMSQPVWAARHISRHPSVPKLRDGERVTLGFDGSRGRAKGKPDATALIGCRVSDGHIFEIKVWEAPEDQTKWATWEPPIVEIEAAIDTAFRTYRIDAFYADPGKDWRSHVDSWEAKYGERVQFKASPNHPFEWWMTGGRSGLVERAIEALESAIRNGDITHDGSFRLTNHVLNSRRRLSHGKLALAKDSDYSPDKIDAAVAAVLAYQARLDALTRVTVPDSGFYLPKRLY